MSSLGQIKIVWLRKWRGEKGDPEASKLRSRLAMHLLGSLRRIRCLSQQISRTRNGSVSGSFKAVSWPSVHRRLNPVWPQVEDCLGNSQKGKRTSTFLYPHEELEHWLASEAFRRGKQKMNIKVISCSENVMMWFGTKGLCQPLQIIEKSKNQQTCV